MIIKILKRSVITVFIILTVICYFSFVFGDDFIDIRYSRVGKDNLTLQPISRNIGYKIRFKGSTEYPYLWFKFFKLKDNGQKKKNRDHIDSKHQANDKHISSSHRGHSHGSQSQGNQHSGTSSQANIIKERQVKLVLKDKKNFDYYYYFKDGKGKYKVLIMGGKATSGSYSSLCNFTVETKEDIPYKLDDLTFNDKVIKYVDSVMGKKVGRGECWDLAQDMLDYYNADWKRILDFGIPLDPEKDEIIPGDIVQMWQVKLVEGHKRQYFGRPRHTAIIYEVKGKKNYILAHQNIQGKRYVIKGEFNMNNLVSGTVHFYRPIQGFIEVKK